MKHLYKQINHTESVKSTTHPSFSLTIKKHYYLRHVSQVVLAAATETNTSSKYPGMVTAAARPHKV
jgi:hypothetical protein